VTDARLTNELMSFFIRCTSNEKGNGKNDCMFWNTPMCDGIKVCSSCSMRIEEGDAE
jgi:hypothetical protein